MKSFNWLLSVLVLPGLVLVQARRLRPAVICGYRS
jgi:hypothetical protein